MPRTAYLKKFLKECTGFDSVLHKVTIITADKGNCLAKIKLEPEHLNVMGGLHGGFSTTLVDVVSGLGLLTHHIGEILSVSISINMSFIKGAVEGDSILIQSRVLRVGKNIAYLDVEIRNEKTGELLVKGHHTKYIGQNRSKI